MPPKTGDSTLVWLYVGLLTAAMGSMLFVVGKEYTKTLGITDSEAYKLNAPATYSYELKWGIPASTRTAFSPKS